MRYVLVASVAVCSAVVLAAPIPKLTVEEVVSRGLAASDQVRLLDSDLLTRDVAKLQAQAPLSSTVGSKLQHLDNRFESASGPFAPSRISASTWTSSAQTQFASGTSLTGELVLKASENEYPPNPATSGIDPKNFESQVSVGVRQSLWRNGFGANTKSQLQAAELTSQAIERQNLSAKEDLGLEFSRQYFQAWFAQAQLQAAKELLTRQKRLLQVTRIKEKRGTSERADVLQLEAAVINSEQSVADLQKALRDIWEGLVIALKLPADLLKIDPSTIEMVLETGASEGQALCAKHEFAAANRPPNPAIAALEAQAKAAQIALDQTNNQQKPDLFVEARVATNGIDDDFGPTVEEVGAAQNPLWSAAIGIEVNMDHFAERARSIEAFKTKQVSEIRIEQIRSRQDQDWRRLCSELRRTLDKITALRLAEGKQKIRSKEESERFRVAQSEVLAVIQAENDAISANLNLQRARMLLQQNLWEIRRLNSSLLISLRR